MDVLVVGASGLLGSNVVKTAIERGLSVAGTYRSTQPRFEIPLRELDVRDSGEFVRIVDEFSPSFVVNCAAMTDVDACEQRPRVAHATNADAPEAMASHCSERGVQFVHVSTDYVFDGTSNERYSEDRDHNPLQVYGKTKSSGDRNVKSVHESALIVRPSFVYGINRAPETPEIDGFPAWVHSRLSSDQDVPLFTDQHVTPSRAGSTAEAIFELITTGASGTYNVAARTCVTPYEFGRVIASAMGIERELLEEGSLEDIERAATRPINTCLAVQKLETRIGRIQSTLKEDVEAIASFF